MERKRTMAAALAVLAGQAAMAARPNIIVAMVDDMGYSDIGCYGGETRTPHLDKLAENGLRFRNFYNTARCSPTRAAIMTGCYAHQVADDTSVPLPNLRHDNNITLAELLREQGYRTYMAGKWHLGTKDGQLPWNRGFQHVYGFGKSGAANAADYWDRKDYRLTSENNEIPARAYGDGPYAFYQSDALADYSIDFIDHHLGKGDGAPFFLYLAPRAPHWDLCAPRETAEYAPPGGRSYLDIYRQGWDVVRQQRYDRMLAMGVVDGRYRLAPFGDTPGNQGRYLPVPAWDALPADRQEDLARRMAIYTAMIDRVDAMMGRIVAHLRKTGQFENTLVLFLSDNGACAEGGLFGGSSFGRDPLVGEQLGNMGQPFAGDKLKQGGGWANVSGTPFRLYKKYNHEGGIRTPLIAHWPAGIKDPGRWSEQVGHVIDVMPTVVEIAGAVHPSSYQGRPVLPMEGESLAPAFAGRAAAPRTIGFEHETNRAWIDGRWKLVTKNFAATDGSSPAHELELYDMEADPVELANLASAHPERLAAMVGAWNAWAARVGIPMSRQLGVGKPAAARPAKPKQPGIPGKILHAETLDPASGWTLVGGAGSFEPRDASIFPTAGEGYFNFAVNPGHARPYANRAAAKDLGTVLQAGKTYTVAADLNRALARREFIAPPFSGPVSESIAFGFFDPAGIDLDRNSNAERLKVRDAINALLLDSKATLDWKGRAVPGGADWETWTYSFTIAPGSPFAGRRVWFGVYGGHEEDGPQKSMALGNLRIAVSDR